jgi:predicted transcriptional regulator
MTDGKAPELRREHQRLVEVLMRAGLGRNPARVVVFIAVAGRTYSAQIQAATGLRQPEVSIALRDLADRRWVVRQAVQREGKGRPINVYRLRRSVGEIAEWAERELDRKARELDKDRDDLRSLTARLKVRE